MPRSLGTTSAKKIASNRNNADKSRGPITAVGKKRTSSNALKHGFYSRELKILDEDKEEFESIRVALKDQLLPSTALQMIAYEQILSACWRCKLAIRLEMRRVWAHLENRKVGSNENEGESAKNGPQSDEPALQWYGASVQDLNRGIKMLMELRADVSDCGGLHLKEREGEITKVFGAAFYDALKDWAPMNTSAIQLAETIRKKEELYRLSPLPTEDPGGTKVVPDPRQQWQMLVKLVDVQIQHLSDLRRISSQGILAIDQHQGLTDFVPRYFTGASRDLQRSVDWYLYLRDKNL